jgi:hypothetical protein
MCRSRGIQNRYVGPSDVDDVLVLITRCMVIWPRYWGVWKLSGLSFSKRSAPEFYHGSFSVARACVTTAPQYARNYKPNFNRRIVDAR